MTIAASFVEISLASDQTSAALIQDSHLVAPQGMILNSADGSFWIADNATGVATIYRGDVGGSPLVRDPLVVSIPGGVPTGVIANQAPTGFSLGSSASASFLFDTENGQVAAWNANVPPPPPSSAAQSAATKPSANYTALAQLSTGQSNFLLAANFHTGQIDVFDDHFAPAALPGDLVDPDLPSGYAPFNLVVINGRLYVAYAKQDATAENPVAGAADGAVAVFDGNGNFQTQLIGAGGASPLNAPYGMAIAPSGFVGLGGDLLVANSGDGRINVFDSATGAFLGDLNNISGEVLAIDGLRSLSFGDGRAGDANSLYFTADPSGGQYGLFGKLVDAENSPLSVVGTGISATEGAAFGGIVAALGDADPNARASDFAVNIDWGDGVASPGTAEANGSGGFNIFGSHVYAEDAAVAHLTITVSDVSGHTATASGRASIAEGNLLVNGVTITTLEGAAHAFGGTVATFTDTGSSDAANMYTASVDWGDGVVSAGSIVSSGGVFSVLSSHIYLEEGSFTVSVSVSETGVTPIIAGSTASLAVVSDADSMTATGASLSGTEGQTVGGTVATFADLGNPSAGTGDFTAVIDWGDGTSAVSGSLTGANGLFTVSGRHAYAERANPYNITVILREAGAGATSWTAAGVAAIADADSFVGASRLINATEGQTLSGATVATFTDSNLATPASDLTATIDWGDDKSDAGQVSGTNGNFTVAGSHMYADDGSYPIKVILSERSPGTASGLVTSTASVAEADFTATSQTLSATEGALATLTQFFSDPNSIDLPSDMTALISWGDGANATAASLSGSGGQFTITAQHVYADEGSFTGHIAIVEGLGANAVAVGAIPLSASVADADSITMSASPLSTDEGASASFILATFSNSNPAAAAADFTATIDWGDGSSASAGVITLAGGVFTVSGSHAFADEGAFNVTTSIAEDSGRMLGSAISHATISDSDALTAQGATVAASEGQTFSGAVATFTDSNASAAASDFSATITWGDGGPSSTGQITGSNGVFTVSGVHAYSDDGSFAVRATISESGILAVLATVTATGAANVREGNDFAATIAPSIRGTEGQSLSGVVVATFSDTGSSDPPGQFSATIDWGDHAPPDPGSITGSNGSYTVVGSHTYRDEGAFPVKVAIVSATGTTISATGTATIAEGDVLAGQGASVSPTASAAFNGVVATFTDANAATSAGDFAATIDWGDGTSATPGVVTLGNGVFTVSGGHTYSQAGSQPIKTTLTEKSPGSAVATAIANATVAASSQSLVGIPVVVSQGEVASNVTVARFTDSLAGTGVSQYAAVIDWGDGVTSAGVVAASIGGDGFTVAGSHSYYGAGTRNLKVTLHGPGGTMSQADAVSTVGSATEIFVSQVYRHLLQREPETQGLEYWTNRIDGGSSRATEALNIEHTHEYRLVEIQGLFRQYLRRTAEPAALVADETFLINGGTSEQLAVELVASDEYFRNQGGSTHQGFLNSLYADVLLRSADQNAEQFYSNENFGLEAARIEAVQATFASGEYYRKLISAPGADKFDGWIAYGWYQALLNRDADGASESHDAAALASGEHDESIVAEIIGSQEYFDLWRTRVNPMQP